MLGQLRRALDLGAKENRFSCRLAVKGGPSKTVLVYAPSVCGHRSAGPYAATVW